MKTDRDIIVDILLPALIDAETSLWNYAANTPATKAKEAIQNAIDEMKKNTFSPIGLDEII